MMWMVMIRGGESVWARINYGRSNQVIMQSRQQPSGKKLITAPDRSRRKGEGGGAGAGGEGERGGEGEVGEEKEYFGPVVQCVCMRVCVFDNSSF